MANLGLWLEATRPKTLPAAVCPVLIGTALAYSEGAFDWRAAGLCLLFSILVQIGTNFANDFLDGVKGADTKERLGPRRLVASGLIPAQTMKWAALITLAVGFLFGLGLVVFGGWMLIWIGLASVICAWLYTGGPYPLAYNALGDVFVILFFGLIAVSFTFFVQAGYFSLQSILFGLSCGLIINNLLVINNLRDVDEDRSNDKRTLIVLLGAPFGRRFYLTSILLAGVIAMVALPLYGIEVLLVLIPLGLGSRVAFSLKRLSGAADYFAALKTSGIVVALYGICLSAAIAF